MDLQISSVIPCKEQLHYRYTYEMVEAWPLDALTIAPSAATLGPNQLRSIPEGVYQRNGLWARVDDEIADTADMEAQEFSETGSVAQYSR